MNKPLVTTSTPRPSTSNERKLYGHYGSACTDAVLIVLSEKRATWQFELVDLSRGENTSSVHLTRQPFGVIPYFEDAEVKLYESEAIARYLDASLPGVPLTPPTLAAQALMNQWLSVCQCYFKPAMGQLFRHRFLNAMRGAPVDPDVIAKSREEIARVFDVLDGALTRSPHLAGSDFSLADVFYVPSVRMLFFLGEQALILERPALAAWWERVSERPSVREVAALSR